MLYIKKAAVAAAAAAAVLIAVCLLCVKFSDASVEYGEKAEYTEDVFYARGGSPPLPVLMYHSVLADPSRTGDYVITPVMLERDLIYLKEHGYTAVTPDEIISFADGEGDMPEKPVLITFDDGHLNNMTYVLPLLKKYGMTAVINTVGAFTLRSEKENDPNPYYAYLTREDISVLEDSGRFYIGCHTYNMHSLNGRTGAARKQGEDSADYMNALAEDTDRWLDMFGGSQVYAYPYGYISEEGFPVLRERGFRIILTCRENNNIIVRGGMKDGLIVIDRYNRSGLAETEDFMNAVGIK